MQSSVLAVSARFFKAFAGALLTLAILFPATAQPQAPGPSFSKQFLPDTIGPGSTSELVYTIDNGGGSPISDLAFTHVLPAGLILASPASPTNDCGGTLTAPDGGTTISLAGGGLGSGSICTIRVDITGSSPGTFTSTTGDLTSSAGNSGSATDDLTIDPSRLGFSKNFNPSTVQLGGRSTLAFTVDASAVGSNTFNGFFTDSLPTGLVVADPANASIGCTGSFTPAPGDTTVSAFSMFLPPGTVCTLVVDVQAQSAGTLVNRTGTLSSTAGDSGFAVDSLEVNVDRLAFTKEFIDDPVAPGESATLRFSLTYFGRTDPATSIAFTDDLNATLSGLAVAGALPGDPCGPGSTLSGTSLLTLSGGNLGPNETCTFDVELLVPTAALPGAYPNVTSAISADVGGQTEIGAPATGTLIVAPVPGLTKRFLDSNTLQPVGSVLAGGDVVMEFTVTNGSDDFSATAISFFDPLDAFLPGVTTAVLPTNPCGAGSSATVATLPDGPALFLNNGSLPAGGSCTFQVTLDIPPDAPLNLYTNITTGASATVDGTTYTGLPASAALSVLAPPVLTKTFINGVEPGGTVDLEFELTFSENAPAPATSIAFTDDLEATLSGLNAISLPANGFCGPTSQITGISTLTITGASLDPGASCTFAVTVQVPAGALPGDYPNTTSPITATIDGQAVNGPAFTSDLRVLGLQAFKAFTDDPAVAGGTVTLEFTLDNGASPDSATGISFTDDLGNTLAGLVPTGLPVNDVCGIGSQLAVVGGDLLVLSGGSLPAGGACTFSVQLQVPAGTPSGQYSNTTSSVSATIGGTPETIEPAADVLTVIEPLSITKEFTDDPVEPGQTVTLEFTLSNASPSDSATGLSFTDDLDAALSGLTVTGAVPLVPCGVGSSVSGASVVTFFGGNLGPAESCSFSLTLQVPGNAPVGSTVVNTTSQLSGNVGGAAVTAPPASDTLQIDLVDLTKAFAGPTAATGTVVLTFQIANLSVDPISGLGFTDDLAAVLPGLSAVVLPASPCGAGSSITGTSLLIFAGGSLAAGASCSFDVTLQVPAGAAAGSYPNVTSPLFASGIPTGSPATDTLQIEPPPAFAKTFADAQMPAGDITTLTFSIDNTASALAATDLDFTDTLPAGMTVAAPANATTTCTGGTLTASPGASSVSYTGGSVAAGGTCTVSVDVRAIQAGTLINTSGDLTSSSGNSGPASDDILIDPPPPPVFTKGFAPATMPLGATSTLTFTIDNGAALLDATSLNFVDSFPAGLVVADPANVANACGGAFTAPTGAGTVSLTGGAIAAGATCTISVDVEATTAGTFTNVSGDLTSSSGNSGSASAGLQVTPPPPPGFTKAFADSPIPVGATTTLTFSIDNAAALVDAGNLAFVDNLPAGLEVADPTNVIDGCGGTATTAPGATTLAYAGGSIAAGAACSISVDVAAVQAGSFTNTTGDLTSTSGNSGTASAPITIDPPPPPTFAKGFADPQIAVGATTTLTFSIDNAAALVDADDLAFVDNLPVGLEVADPANTVNGCGGALSAVPAGASISLTTGSVAAGTACSISVDVAAVQAGSFTNTTGDLTSTSGNSGTASAAITIDPPPPPGFAKAFAPDDTNTGAVSTLTFSIDNAAALVAADDLAFTDNLPPGMEIADPANAANACGGTLTSTAGTTSIALSGGSVAAESGCTIDVDVTTTTSGTKVNTTSDLTSTAGNSGPATATLIARAAPAFSKAFAPDTITLGGTSTLTFTIDNAAKTVPADNLDFTDPLPSGMTVANPSNAATTCAGGTLTAAAGSSTVSYTGGSVAAGASCTVAVDVVGDTIGSLQNVSGALTSTLGDSGTASAALTVTEDSDGVPAAIEDLAPNNGDGNNDGIPDGTQDSVASLPTFDNSGFMTVEIISGCTELNNVAADSPANQGASLPNRQFPFGLVGFELPCESAVVDVIFHGGGSRIAQGYFKYGPTTPGDAASSSWYEFSAVGGSTGAAYAGGDVWTLTLADNALGDATGDDGRIVDPGGPVVRALPVPIATGGWLVLLTLAIALLSLSALRARNGRAPGR